MSNVLITGANRGLGLEFVRQYAHLGWNVIATCRNPDKATELVKLAESTGSVRVHEMDVTAHDRIDALASELHDLSLDLFIANAGVYGDSTHNGFGQIDYDVWRQSFEANVFGAVKVAEAFSPQLSRAENSLIAVVSSLMGSIDDNTSGGSLYYRSSKAALNAAMKSLAIDLQPSGIGVLIFHPGWVRTDMGGPHALIDAEKSVSGMVNQIEAFDISDSGSFIKYDGSLMPW